jgi:hypothetical protein
MIAPQSTWIYAGDGSHAALFVGVYEICVLLLHVAAAHPSRALCTLCLNIVSTHYIKLCEPSQCMQVLHIKLCRVCM